MICIRDQLVQEKGSVERVRFKGRRHDTVSDLAIAGVKEHFVIVRADLCLGGIRKGAGSQIKTGRQILLGNILITFFKLIVVRRVHDLHQIVLVIRSIGLLKDLVAL